jgi:hypothetical protein
MRLWRLGFTGLVAVLLVMTGEPVPIRADSAARAYVLTAGKISMLLDGAEVSVGPNQYEDWDASVQYVLPGFDTDLYVSASVLADDSEARRFVGRALYRLASGNERTSIWTDGEAGDLAAHELYHVSSTYHDDGRRVSAYGRLIRVGRTVALVEAIGDPEADDQGFVDNDRALAMTRAFELVVGKIHFYPADTAAVRADMRPFALSWSRHGVGLSVDPTGHGEASWRIYSWCSDDPQPPCDLIQDNIIMPGGHGAFVFHRVSGQTAYGTVIGTTDPRSLPLGPIIMTVGDYGMAELTAGDQSMILCGPDFLKLAPPDVQAEFPCGA